MTQKLSAHKIAIIGAGKMGGILLQAFLKRHICTPGSIWPTVHHADKAARLSQQRNARVGTDNHEAVRHADIVFLCVKPQNVAEVVEEIAPDMTPAKLLISIAASVPTAYIEKRLAANVPVIRAMPNTPSMVGSGITVICGGFAAGEKHLETARKLFESVGRVLVMEEKHMDAVTALSASGPAYMYIILESLAEAGVKVGLPRELATLLAAQTALGASKMVLETGDHPALLKDAVTTPAGCTIDGILELEEGKLRVTLIKAVVKAAQRAKELMFST